jgi:hypothetical protein
MFSCKRPFSLFFLVFLFLGLPFGKGWASEWQVDIIRNQDIQKRLRPIVFPEKTLLLKEEGKEKFFIELKGRLTAPLGWIILRDHEPLGEVRSQAPLSFQVRVDIEGLETSVLFRLIGPRGQLHEEEVLLLFKDYRKLMKDTVDAPRSWRGVVGLGVTSIHYQQKKHPQLSQMFLTPTFSADYHLVPGKWSLGAMSYYNAIRLSGSRDDTSLSFLGINFRLRYQAQSVPEPFSIHLAGGVFYTTSFSSGRLMGFQNLITPHLFPMLGYRLDPKNFFYIYFKYAPLADFIRILNLRNRELAVGLGWSYLLPWEQSLTLGLNASDISLNYRGVNLQSRVLSFDLSYSF